ncbi:hypothetical protein [Williamsia sterculiae]|uniref:hypothetical protein n=1 Tax=Williamsia sterculiae TaxID=1344003 RepID=UPI00117E9D8B|nr:hypothetical protein [Williamsia sterculiae]
MGLDDTVITIVEARDWAVASVSVWWAMTGEPATLHHVGPIAREGVSLGAIESHMQTTLPRRPETLSSDLGAALLEALRAEVDAPTSWRTTSPECDAPRSDAIGEAEIWGCRCCGRDRDAQFAPRFESHAEHSGADWVHSEKGVGVCPSCHDILHQPLAPTVDELMFSNRPQCPRCREKQALHLILGMPPGPPPHGAVAGGCVIMDGHMPDWVCGACGEEW